MKKEFGDYRRGVFLAVYRIEKYGNLRKIEYILLKRRKHWIGWEFPKGGAEKNESLFSAVKRETYEETGLKPIKIKKFKVFGRYKYSRKFRDRVGYIGQTYQLFSCQVKKAPVKLDKKEHSSFLWLSFDLALKKLKWPNQKKCLMIVNKNIIKSKTKIINFKK